MDELQQQELYHLWRQHDAGIAVGAFSNVRHNDITFWHDKEQLRVLSYGDDIMAACVVHKIRRNQLVHDFRDKPILVQYPRDVMIQRMMCRKGADDELLKLICASASGKRSFVQVWQEHATERQLVERMGLQLQGVKIKSTAEIVGIYGDVTPQERLTEIDVAGISPLSITYDAAALQDELSTAQLSWSNHYSYYNNNDSWQALALRGYSGSQSFIIKPAEMTREWKALNKDKLAWGVYDTPLMQQFPAAEELVRSIPAAKQRIRLMRLTPRGGELQRHTDLSDPECGTDDGQIMRLHFPITTNKMVMFESWTLDGRRQHVHMASGQGWYLDVRKPHTARNDGTSDRVHLVIDVHANQMIRRMVHAQDQ